MLTRSARTLDMTQGGRLIDLRTVEQSVVKGLKEQAGHTVLTVSSASH